MTQTDSENTSSIPSENSEGWFHRNFLPIRKALIRGLAIMMPPLLTIVLFLWAWNIIDTYVLAPVETSVRYLIVFAIQDIRDDTELRDEVRANDGLEITSRDGLELINYTNGTTYVRVNKTWIPLTVYESVEANPGAERPETAVAYYHRYVSIEYLPRHLVIPIFLAVFLLILYLLGRIFAVGVGRMMWSYVESVIQRLPIISKVYAAVKQVTDFAFNDSEIQFTRVVAVEYPRRGLWTMGFVTGESLREIRNASGEPMVSVLMPTSPMPATGFIINVPKSQTVEMDISIDQMIQFCVSCGVVVPSHQQNSSAVDGTVESILPAPTVSLPESTTEASGPIDDDEPEEAPG